MRTTNADIPRDVSGRTPVESNLLAASALLVAILLAAGCSDSLYDLAPVSGLVTLDGSPVPDATIKFAPEKRAAGEDTIVGPGSYGRTDERGRYTLKTYKGERGALVGKHRISISTGRSRFVDLKKSEEVETVVPETIPSQYNRESILTLDVPSGGTSEADFELVSDKSASRGQ